LKANAGKIYMLGPYKKEARCEEGGETFCGGNWDHTAIDPEHRLLLSIVPGKRTLGQCQKVVDEAKKRTGGRTDLIDHL
jgi:hypothetical protein